MILTLFSQINGVFDTISYSKGASVLRMLENFMEEGDFLRGVSKFLVEYEFDNAITEQLFEQLQSITDLNITKIMDTWTRQKGFPVLTLSKSEDGDAYIVRSLFDCCRPKATSIQATQERFLADPEADETEPSDYGYKWEIPVTLIDSEGRTDQLWMHMEDETIDM